MRKILDIKGLVGGYIPEVNILQGIDLELHQGEAVGVIGLNGCGKSTLGKAILNMIPFRKGEIIYNDVGVMNLPASKLSRQGLAIMLQGGQVFSNLSVWDNLQLAFRSNPQNDCISVLKSVVPLLSLSQKELKTKMADKLSGGQRHQLSLAMSLARNPKLLILDEPSAGLSPKSVDEMYDMLSKVREEMDVIILLIEQNVNKAMEFCDRCLLLEQGVIVHEFKNKEIKEIESIMFKK